MLASALRGGARLGRPHLQKKRKKNRALPLFRATGAMKLAKVLGVKTVTATTSSSRTSRQNNLPLQKLRYQHHQPLPK